MTSENPRRLYLITILISISFAAACGSSGGGSGGGGSSGAPADQFSVSTNTLDFTAGTPVSRVDSQTITGSVSGDLKGVLYIVATAGGSVVSSISNFNIDIATQSGTADVAPVAAATLGEGIHTDTITVRACLDDMTCATGELSGSPQTIDITYSVGSSVAEETVMPHVVSSGGSGEVVIRGFDFISDGIDTVRFNSTDATSIDVVSNSEIHATFPALTADTYSVQLFNVSGPTAFSGNLVVVDAPAFAATTLSYPSAPSRIHSVVYDAEREALLVAASYFDRLNFNTDSRQGNEVLRYQFNNGAFVTMTSATVPLLQGLSLSPDASQLIAISDRTVWHLDPETLTEISSTQVDAAVSTRQYLKDIVVANDGNALITTGLSGSGSTPVYLYPLARNTLSETTHPDLYNGSPAGAANGSYAVFIEGILSSAQPLREYRASSGTFSEPPINANQVQCLNSFLGLCVFPAVDPSGQLFAIIDSGLTVNIYDRSHSLAGKLPISSRSVAFNHDGTRLYAIDGNTLREYDLTAATDVNNDFPEIGAGTAIPSPGTGPGPVPHPARMVLSADGGTLFIAGNDQIVIQPVP